MSPASPESDSQTVLKELFVSEVQRVDVNSENVDDIFDHEVSGDNPLYRLQDLLHRYTKEQFMSNIIADAGSDTTTLERTREFVFSTLQQLDAYPYSNKC